MKKYIEQNGITYELRGEQYYPLLELPEQRKIGKYGRLHLEYLKAHRKGLYLYTPALYRRGNRLAGGGLPMSVIKELWHGNIIPQEDSRTNSKEIKELLGYMSLHHEDLEKSFSDELREVFEKFHDCWSEYMSLAEAAIFEYAFKFGMQIAIESLTGK